LRIGRVVALKAIIADDLSPEELRQQKEWFYREARTAGKMTHPGIVTVLDIAEDEAGHPYIVMEYVEGEPLERALSRRDLQEPLNFSQRMSIAIQLAKALDYAHRHGVVHRDIKPSNVLISEDGHAKIVDFGIAMIAEPKANGSDQLPGTPAFVAPELLRDSPANARSDIFSLGVVLYWMFTGEIPFSGSTVTEITYNVAHTNPPPARQVNWALPEELDEVLRKCLAKNPAERYASAGMLAADLVALRDGRPQAARALHESTHHAEILYQAK
jgi:serine/threonine-protein kinase